MVRAFLVQGTGEGARIPKFTVASRQFRSSSQLNPIANALADKPDALRRFLDLREEQGKPDADNASVNPLHPELLLSNIGNRTGNEDFARPNRFMIRIAGATTRTTSSVSPGNYLQNDPNLSLAEAEQRAQRDQNLFSKFQVGNNRGSDDILMHVEAFVFPGRSLLTSEFTTYGPHIKIPYGVLYNDATLTIRCKETMPEREFFANWQHFGLMDEHYDAKFLFEGTNDVQIFQLGNPEGEAAGEQPYQKYVCTLHNAFPTILTEIPLDYSADNQVAKLNVTMNYTHWSSEQLAS